MLRRTPARRPTPWRHEGAGEPVLLLHGFTLSHHSWGRVVDDLATDHEVLALTMPGHWGGPELPASKATVQGLVDGVERALDEAGWDSCHIAGNSLGGWVALELARRGRARSVVAVAPAGGWLPWGLPALSVGVKFAVLLPLAQAGRVVVRLPAGSGLARRIALYALSGERAAVDLHDVGVMLLANRSCRMSFSFVWSALRTGAAFTAYDEIAAPVHLVLCGRDTVIPPRTFGRLFAERLPSVVVTTLETSGHVPMLEAPEEVAAIIRTHVAAAEQVSEDQAG